MVQFLLGDCLETLKTLPEKSIQCCVTSPPYYGLRNYGVEGQIGLEETPEAYVTKLVAVFQEVKRVLKDDGVLWLNIGDSYWGSGKGLYGNRTSHGTEGKKQKTNQGSVNVPRASVCDTSEVHLKSKDLIGIPWLVAFALRADGWWLRQDIIWAKPNPMPESVKDRCTKSHEYIFLLTKSARYYYDAAAIAEPVTQSSMDRINRHGFENQIGSTRVPGKTNGNMKAVFSKNLMVDGQQLRNKRDVWTVTTKSYKGEHFATFPPDLIEPCILAGSRIGDTILDPFNGSGTTGAVSVKHGRNYIGCELNPDYIELSKKRIELVK
jgi:DNA modification methylase